MEKKRLIKISILFLICVGIFFIVFFPHYTRPFPIHIDEWHHITEVERIKNNVYALNSATAFELGFHLILYALSLFSNLVLIYKFLPAIWAIISALTLFYCLYKKTSNFYIGIFSMIFFASIKTNTNLTGMWFFTPLTFSIPFIFLYFYFFTEGIEKQNKKQILISLVIMTFLIPVHSISVLFSIPILIIYSLFHKDYLKKEWKFFSLFLSIPIIGIIFFSFITKQNPLSAILAILNQLQFKYGWGVLELKNSPLEVYSLIGYILAAVGIISIYLYNKDAKKYFIYIIWPIWLIFMIIFYRIFGVSFLSPYQRNFYYFAISLPFLSAIGLNYLFLKLNRYLNTYALKRATKIIIFSLILALVIFFTFKDYTLMPKQTPIYTVIDQNDYKALQYLSTLPHSKVLSTPFISTAMYPISHQTPISTIYFEGLDKRKEIEQFFRTNDCTLLKEIISDYKVKYILSKNAINCKNLTLVYNQQDKIYKIG